MNYVRLPLYPRQDYFYSIVLDGIACVLRIYYNQRVDGWFMDLRENGGDYFVQGLRLVPLYPMAADYTALPFDGFFWLEPIGDSIDKFRTDAFHLSKWFRFFFITDIDEPIEITDE